RPSAIKGVDVVLTSYDLCVADVSLLASVQWRIVVADEAQAIKNPDSLRWNSIARLPRKAAFGVTGTPLENRTLDVWALAEFAKPGHLGSRESFALRLEEAPDKLAKAIRPLILRRTVGEVADDLPPRVDIDVALEMFAPEA